MTALVKFPRTPHLERSHRRADDEDLAFKSFDSLKDKYVVVTEKVDGANTGISFGPGRELRLQSRGHFLTGGPREKQFALLKTWANAKKQELWEILGQRHILYGEWLYAKHTIFYDQLPHYFLAFDVLDIEIGEFLGSARCRTMLNRSPVMFVPVLSEGKLRTRADLISLLRQSRFRSDQWRDRLSQLCVDIGLDEQLVIEKETDPSDKAEGLYIKLEHADRVAERCKFVRRSFVESVDSSESHWQQRPIVPNQLCDGVDIFGTSS